VNFLRSPGHAVTPLLFAVAACRIAPVVLAGIPEGLSWFTAQPNPNGSFGSTASSLATAVQSTAEVLGAPHPLPQGSTP
jgi:hypothetical protein